MVTCWEFWGGQAGLICRPKPFGTEFDCKRPSFSGGFVSGEAILSYDAVGLDLKNPPGRHAPSSVSAETGSNRTSTFREHRTGG